VQLSCGYGSGSYGSQEKEKESKQRQQKQQQHHCGGGRVIVDYIQSQAETQKRTEGKRADSPFPLHY
jgi:hypothetical protein